MRLLDHQTGEEAIRLLRLAWPVMLTSLNWTILHLIDVAVVGHYSTAELGGLAAARTLTFVAVVVAFGAISGVLVAVSRSDGAKDLPATGHHLRRGIWAALIIGFSGMVILILSADPAIAALGVPHGMAERGAAVVRTMALGFPGLLLMASSSYFLEGISRPKRVTLINLAILPLNALLAWVLVRGEFGLPALGAVGASAATATVNLFGAVALLLSIWRLPDARARDIRNLSVTAWVTAARDTPSLLRFGAMPAFASGLELGGFSWLIALSTRLGDVTAGALQTVFSLHNLLFGVAMGLASAAGVRVGNAVGAGETHEARHRAMIAAALACLMLGGGAAVMAVFAHATVSPFSDDPRLLAQAAAMLMLLAPFTLFDGVQLVFVYALRSLGDQVAAGVASILGFFFVTAGVGWGLFLLGWGAKGLILGMGAGMVVTAALQAGRFIVVSRRSALRS